MRAWILSAALAAAVMGGLPTSTFAAPPPTPTPKAEPSPTQAKGKPAPTAVLPSPTATVLPTPKPAPPTATPVPPTATATPPATATATSAPTRAASPTAPAATATPVAATPSPSPAATATSGASTSTGTGTLRGRTFVDTNADGQFADGEAGLGQVSVKLPYANGLTRTAATDDAGSFAFDALVPGPSQVRGYLNNLIDNCDTDLGTSLDVLSRIGREAGLTPMDLYSDQGGYRNWSTDAVRWHVQQGHPVITLVKYRNLPGHTSSVSDFDHYIVITGLTPNGFIYNDGAFSTTLGYGLEISDIELEYAWENSSIPHHALALGLAPDQHAVSFPELPRKPRT